MLQVLFLLFTSSKSSLDPKIDPNLLLVFVLQKSALELVKASKPHYIKLASKLPIVKGRCNTVQSIKTKTMIFLWLCTPQIWIRNETMTLRFKC